MRQFTKILFINPVFWRLKRSRIAIRASRSLCALASIALILGVAVPEARADGLIVPAYLPLSDATNWNILQEGAAIVRDGNSARFKDYWVAVNSGNNGPFYNAADWAIAKTRFDPIRANSGKIFGYVHSLATPDGTQFRPLADVKRDIDNWVAGYEGLDGIWLDEFYPRYEIAGPSGASATFPNEQNNASKDRSFLNPDGSFNAAQVDPAGGYYAQLTNWIRATHPDLKIIGNAGGQFYSNQTRYADLVDVTCSFEQTLAVAANMPTGDWANLNQQIGTENNKQLALIHTNSTDLMGVINQAKAHNYSYFYTTDRTLDNNIWGGLPPYFTSQVEIVANLN